MKFYLIALSQNSGIDLDLLIDDSEFLTMAQAAYAQNDFEEAIQIGIEWLNNNY